MASADQSIDAFGLPPGSAARPIRVAAPEATGRARLGPRLDLGVRVLNCFTTCREGQRLGLFAASGVGKSTLLAMLARYTACDVAVLALVGERGREVREFLEDELGAAGLARAADFSPWTVASAYASLYADVRPSFVVDITPFIEQRHLALMAYRSQYANQSAGSGLFVPEEEIRERTFAEARHYGLLAGVRYGEPFVQKEVGLVDDLTLLPVQSI